jgi:adenylate cyclase class 2
MQSFEVEQKYHVDDLDTLERKLRQWGAVEQPPHQHSDTYFNHPSRDFAQTQEALRIRRVDGCPLVTYKGPKLPGAIKARRELEWQLDPGDPDGTKMEELLEVLGFRRVAMVRKQRRRFAMSGDLADFGVVIDQVARLGLFAEIELIVADHAHIESSRDRIGRLGEQLGLHRSEPRSYLRMLLEQDLRGNVNASS